MLNSECEWRTKLEIIIAELLENCYIIGMVL